MSNIITDTANIFNAGNFVFDCGKNIESLDICYETWGSLNDSGSNAILVTHALTGTSHAASSVHNSDPGWWEFLIGAGRPIDTDKYFVVCAHVPGGCVGSSGPSSIDPVTGQHYGANFPTVTVRDMVRSQKLLLDHLGVRRLVTVIGASLGGMQSLEWGALYPDSVDSIVSIAAPGRAYPQSIAFRKAQRIAIQNDPDWNGGSYYGKNIPKRGIELARFMGVISYRSEKEFAVRFGRDHNSGNIYDLESKFEIENYLSHHGEKLSNWFDPNSYLYLSKAMDLHDLGFGRETYEQGVRRIKSPLLMIGMSSDMLFPVHQQQEIVNIVNSNKAQYKEIQTLYGHDGFLIEKEPVGSSVSTFLQSII